jgi:hypothetical protein
MTSPMHIVVLGQSNVANHSGSPKVSDVGRVFYKGDFLPLADPVPGGTGQFGSVWTRFAPRAYEAGLTDDLVISLFAQGGTDVEDWTVGGKCHKIFAAAVPELQKCPAPPTHIFYHQGERDTLLETTAERYVELFIPLYEYLVEAFPDMVSMTVCKASLRMGVTSAAVRSAQVEVVRRCPKCVEGPDTDSLGSAIRRDGTHFNDAGLDAFAVLTVESFLDHCNIAEPS